MKKESRRLFVLSVCLLLGFILWTLAICYLDVRAIGPKGSSVGLAALNQSAHDLIGVHMTLYIITDWLGLVPFAVVFGFAVIGLVQWIRRRKLRKVDSDILVLGGFYLITMTLYILFEYVIINYRPILINGILEASYPSSTTMLVMCVIPTAIMQFNKRIKCIWLRQSIAVVLTVFTIFMVIGRLVSGVHWLSDIVGGALLSAGLVSVYHAVVKAI